MKRFLFSNIWMKLLALAFATALWFLVVGESGTEIGFLIPLELKDIPNDMVVTNNPPREIEVRVTGPKTLLSNLSPGQFDAIIDLSKASPAVNKYNLMPEDIKAPRGISVIRLNPSFIKVAVEKLQTKKLHVKVKLTGKPAKGYKVKEININPDMVEVLGIKSQLRSLKSIETSPLNIEGLTSDKNTSLPIEKPKTRLSKISPDAVDVTVIIEEIKGGK
ncbi:MAG: CdaR family protein [Thermodesulfobacteriota bacterium]